MIKNTEGHKSISNLINLVGIKNPKATSTEAAACLSLQKILKTLQPSHQQSNEIQKQIKEMNTTQP
jgi:hypothetical protein